MLLIGKKIIFGLTSAQYTFNKTIPQISKLISEGAEIIPVMSVDSYNIDTKFGKAEDFVKRIEDITLKKVIHTNEEIENIENLADVDIMIISPCSRKCHRKNCFWHNGYTNTKNCKKNFKRR